MAAFETHLDEILTFDTYFHTIVFENRTDLVVFDCGGQEKLRCDLSRAAINLEVDRPNNTLKVGPPDLLPVDENNFCTLIDLTKNTTTLVFERHIQKDDFDLVGTEDTRYQCVVNPSPHNGYKQYRYILSLCRVGLQIVDSVLQISTAVEEGANPAIQHSGFRVMEALKYW